MTKKINIKTIMIVNNFHIALGKNQKLKVMNNFYIAVRKNQKLKYVV